ncbi:MAG: hypothetical protein ISR98_00430 [Parcubacteria group bacterium]|nr:hypothetical protein [Parcubacteria group bacterium]
MSDLLEAQEKTKEAQKEILTDTYQEVLQKLDDALSTAKEMRVRSIPIDKMGEYVKGIVKSGFNSISCPNGLGPIAED